MEPACRISFPPNGDYNQMVRQSFEANPVTTILGESIAVSFVESLISDLSAFKEGKLDELSKKKFLQLFSLYPLLSPDNKDHFARVGTRSVITSVTQLLILFASSVTKRRLLDQFWIAEWERDAFLMLLKVYRHTEKHPLSVFSKNKNDISKDLVILLRVLKNYHTFMKILLDNHPLDYRFKFEKAETSVFLLSALLYHILGKDQELYSEQSLALHLTELIACIEDLRGEFSTLRRRDAAQIPVEEKCWTDLFAQLEISIRPDCYEEQSFRTQAIQNIIKQELDSSDNKIALKTLAVAQQSPLAEYALKIIAGYCQRYKALRSASLEDFVKDNALTITWPSKESLRTFEELSKFERVKQKVHKLVRSLRWLIAPLPPKEEERELHVEDPLYLLRKMAKDWAVRQQVLVPLGNSINNVYRVEDAQRNAIAYFKSPRVVPDKPTTYHTARMERLVCDLAVFLGCEKYFTPTTIVKIKDRNGRRVAGSLQIAQVGAPLHDNLEVFQSKDPSELQPTLTEFIATTVLFSLYDAHEHNILSLPIFSPKLFDNTRSLAHSNKALSWGSKLLSPYRCALLGLAGCSKPLSGTEKQQLQTWLQRIEERCANLEDFFEKHALTLNELPPGWFNRTLTCEALKSRSESIRETLNGLAPTPNDLVFNAFPYFKFFALLTLFRLADPRSLSSSSMLIDNREGLNPLEFQQKILALTGSAGLDELIDTCASARVNLDPQSLFELSQDKSKSFATLLAEVERRYNEAKKKRWEKEDLAKKAHNLKLLFYWMAEIDTKELDPSDDPLTFFDQMQKDCHTLGIRFVADWQKKKIEDTLLSDDTNKPKFIIAGNSMTTSLALFWIPKNGQNHVVHQIPLKILNRQLLCLELEGTLREMHLDELQRFFC